MVIRYFNISLRTSAGNGRTSVFFCVRVFKLLRTLFWHFVRGFRGDVYVCAIASYQVLFMYDTTCSMSVKVDHSIIHERSQKIAKEKGKPILIYMYRTRIIYEKQESRPRLDFLFEEECFGNFFSNNDSRVCYFPLCISAWLSYYSSG